MHANLIHAGVHRAPLEHFYTLRCSPHPQYITRGAWCSAGWLITACTARVVSHNLPAAQRVRRTRAGRMKYVAVGSERTACNVPHHRSTLPAQTNKSLTHSTCVRCDPGSWRASSCHAQWSLRYGDESTERGRSLLCTSALPRADPLQTHRAVDAGRARAVICSTNEQQAVSAVAAAYGVESQRGAPVHGREAQLMSLLDSPAARAR